MKAVDRLLNQVIKLIPLAVAATTTIMEIKGNKTIAKIKAMAILRTIAANKEDTLISDNTRSNNLYLFYYF